MRLLDLADICRRAGLTVSEQPGWQRRGRDFPTRPKSIVCHHTAGPAKARNSKDYPSLGVVVNGRAGLPGPLCQLGIGRSGTVYIVAAGRANHAGRVYDQRYANAHSIGIEAENSGHEPWPEAQMNAYRTLVRALGDAYGISAPFVRGHKEICKPRGRKPDPSFDMDAFRAAVVSENPNQPPSNPNPTGDEETMKLGDKGNEVAQIQRTINGILARTAALGAEKIDEIAVDGAYGPATAAALAHAHKRAQIAVGVDWQDNWSTNEITGMDKTLLLTAVIRLGDQLAAK